MTIKAFLLAKLSAVKNWKIKNKQMKKILLISMLVVGQFANANDSTESKTVLNIYAETNSNRRLFLKLANKKIIKFHKYNSWGFRVFIQLEFKDTGLLKTFLYTTNFFQKDGIPKSEALFPIPISYKGERWLYLNNYKKDLTKLKERSLKFMSNEEFQRQYTDAYERFRRRNFDKVVRDIEMNVEPNRNED